MSDYTEEIVRQIYHDGDGWHVEVGPDRDGLDLVEIRYRDGTTKHNVDLPTLETDCARKLAHAILALCDELEATQ